MRRLLALLIGLLLAGCVTVPTSGPVQRHQPGEQRADPGVDIAPVPPAPGASPGLIVEGFLHAMATYQPGYAVAREFLTPAAGEQWRPESGAIVYAGGFPPQVSGSGVVLTAPMIGALDPLGTFTPGGAQLHHDFGLVQAQGQWRISRPPRGLLISQSLFGSTWVRADVCFWDATGAWLVPDPRFVPSGAVGLSATVRAVLGGPSASGRSAYRDPLETRLQIDSVTQDADGVVTVEFTGPDELTEQNRERLAAELVWSLSSLEGVRGLRVRSNGSAWQLTPGGGPVGTADFARGAPVPSGVPAEVFVVRQGELGRLAWRAAADQVVTIGPALDSPAALAVRGDGQQLAVITDGGTRVRTVSVRDGAGRIELRGSGFTGVRWSRQDELWCVLQRPRGERLRVLHEGRELPVDAEALPEGRIRVLAPAPDGVRMALVIETEGGPVLGVAAVVRTDRQVRFTGWTTLSGTAWAPTNQQPLDVGWVGPVELLVLLGTSPATRVVRLDSRGAVATDVGPNDTSALVELAASATGRAVVRGRDGQTWRLVDEASWEPWLPHVQRIALP